MMRPLVLCLAIVSVRVACAGEVVAAVAANFAAVIERIEPAFEQASGHPLTVVLGSSGKFLAQIQQGAPFDVLLSADAERPRILATNGLGLPDSRFTYAIGKLALWSPDPAAIPSDGTAWLRAGGFRHLAIANPALAPYGVAAQQTLERLRLWRPLQGRLVRADDIGQVYGMTAGGAVEAGFVALSSVLAGSRAGSHWQVPATLYTPLAQDAILLTRARDNPAAHAFLIYLRGPAARAVIQSLGYELPTP